MTDARRHLEFEIGLAIGAVAQNSDLTAEECAEVLEESAQVVRSGVYDGHFASSGGD